MTANLVTVLAVVAGIIWLVVLFVTAIRSRGKEEIPSNLRPGINDQVLETRRLETGQKAAIAFSAFLAISLPLYFLSEPARQEGFVEQFDEESILRGEHIVGEFRCFDCHGPEGTGGTATFIEKRSNVSVSWAAPSLNDVLYRYDRDELTFWITYGRGNTPMPAWGLAGGGPLNEAQVQDVVNYLETIQIPQSQAVNRVPDPVALELLKLDNAESTIQTAILNQDQVVHEVMQAPADSAFLAPLAAELVDVLEGAPDGIDTDDDGLSDAAESAISAISVEIEAGFTVVPPIVMDPAVSDADKAADAAASLRAALETDPIVGPNLDAVESALQTGAVGAAGLSPSAGEELASIAASATAAGITVPSGPYETAEAAADLVAALEDAAAEDGAPAEAATLAGEAASAVEDGSDPDGDGISTAAETEINNQVAAAGEATLPSGVKAITLDPTNPESAGGESDVKTADTYVGNIESLATSLEVSAENIDQLLATEQGGLEYLIQSAELKSYEIDFGGVAEVMGVTEDEARRAVGLFNANCARCHTAGFSAGLPFTQEAGSGGFGPALWDGRPLVQFGELREPLADDLLYSFLVRGSVAQTPYGLNGFGSGRMPAFGAILPQSDIELLAQYLRAGNLDGKG